MIVIHKLDMCGCAVGPIFPTTSLSFFGKLRILVAVSKGFTKMKYPRVDMLHFDIRGWGSFYI